MQLRGQVWVETVLYTLIGLGLIALVLSFVYPRVQAGQERAVIEQSIMSVDTLYQAIMTVLERGPGNVKQVQFKVGAGQLIFVSSEEKIRFQLSELKHQYSQPGAVIEQGSVSVLTEEHKGRYRVTLETTYPRANLTYRGGDEDKTLNAASTPYRISVSNEGGVPNQISISEQ